jgi:hypothetical protein
VVGRNEDRGVVLLSVWFAVVGIAVLVAVRAARSRARRWRGSRRRADRSRSRAASSPFTVRIAAAELA